MSKDRSSLFRNYTFEKQWILYEWNLLWKNALYQNSNIHHSQH